MKRLLLLALALPSMATAQADVSQLGWLAGCWASERGEAGSVEQWLAPAGGTMFGVGRTVRGGRTVAHEFMQLREGPDGLVFIALPSGQREATFKAVTLEPRKAVFENPAHDFPQRVVYESPEPQVLHARIEGQRQGQARVVHFPMRRVACPAP